MSKTRSSAEVWLMGKGTEELSGSNLPTNADAFRLLLFFHVHGTHPWWTKILLKMPKIVRGTGKEQAEACLSTLNDWCLQNRVRHPCKQYWFEERCVHYCTFIARINLGGLPPSRHGTSTSCCFQLLSWVHRGPYFPCSGGSSKSGQASIDHTTYEVASDDMFDSHTSRTNGAILQDSLGRVASKR